MAVEVVADTVAKRLGYLEGLKDLQLQVISGLVGGRDVFGVLPTGYGKSLCFGCLPWVFDEINNFRGQSSIVCVVSPLTAIIEDQVSRSL